MNKNPFIREDSFYNNDLNPVQSYINQSAMFISKVQNIEYDKAKQFVVDSIKKSEAKDPKVKFYFRKENGDKEIRETTLTNYIKTAITNKEVIAPSFTSYVSSKEKNSIHKDFVLGNLKSRSIEKKLAAKYKAAGDKNKASYHDIMQKVKKIFNNSLSGAYASKSTILFNPSAHYTLTSTTRSMASIGNSITEMFVAGNRLFSKPSDVMNYITAVITMVNLEDVKRIVDKYNLAIPTSQDLIGMIKYSSDIYWKSKKREKTIVDYLDRLDDYEKCAVMYVNDLYHIRKLNDGFTRTLLTKLFKKQIATGTPIDDILSSTPDFIFNLVHHICSDDLKGIEPNYKALKGNPLLEIIAATAESAYKVILEYEDFISVFLTAKVLPINIADIKQMTRRSIVLSDTDSTCGSYMEWVEWFFGKTEFSARATALSASVMTLTTQAVDHYLKVLAANMNVDMEIRNILAMKNEYFWETMTPANVSKHYFAGVNIKEGYVNTTPELEIKGVHLIAGNIPKKYKDMSKEMITGIINTITKNEKINLSYWISYVADIEREVIDAVLKGDVNILKPDKIKEENAYKLEWQKSPYYHYKLWTSVFSDKYGEADKPPYTAIKVNTTLSNEKKIKEFIETIKDEEIRSNFKNFLENNPKNSLGVFRLPHSILLNSGIPEELYSVIDIDRTVFDICNVFYVLLETIGFYKKSKFKLVDLGY